jgi:hypothetical protein
MEDIPQQNDDEGLDYYGLATDIDNGCEHFWSTRGGDPAQFNGRPVRRKKPRDMPDMQRNRVDRDT